MARDHDDAYCTDPTLVDLTKRILRITAKAHITIGQCSLVHINCLVSLALEMNNGDREAAILSLREVFQSIEADLRDPSLVFKTLDGKPLGH